MGGFDALPSGGEFDENAGFVNTDGFVELMESISLYEVGVGGREGLDTSMM